MPLITALKYDPWNVVLCLFDLARIGQDQFKLAAPRLVKAEKEIGAFFHFFFVKSINYCYFTGKD